MLKQRSGFTYMLLWRKNCVCRLCGWGIGVVSNVPGMCDIGKCCSRSSLNWVSGIFLVALVLSWRGVSARNWAQSRLRGARVDAAGKMPPEGSQRKGGGALLTMLGWAYVVRFRQLLRGYMPPGDTSRRQGRRSLADDVGLSIRTGCARQDLCTTQLELRVAKRKAVCWWFFIFS